MPLHLVGLSIALSLGLLACGESDGESVDAGPPTLQIGTGSSEFEPLEDGDTIFVVHGPQGGFHLFGSLRATNIDAGDPNDLSDPDNPQTTFEAFVGTEQVDAMVSTYKQGLRDGDGGVFMIGRAVILNIVDDSELSGVEIIFRVHVEDSQGLQLSDERRLIAQPHPGNG